MNLFSTDLTEEEKKEGFVLGKVDNPRGHYAFQPQKVGAVFKMLDDNTRIIKKPSPPPHTGGIFYAVQEKRKDPAGQTTWRPITRPLPSLQALRDAGYL